MRIGAGHHPARTVSSSSSLITFCTALASGSPCSPILRAAGLLVIRGIVLRRERPSAAFRHFNMRLIEARSILPMRLSRHRLSSLAPSNATGLASSAAAQMAAPGHPGIVDAGPARLEVGLVSRERLADGDGARLSSAGASGPCRAGQRARRLKRLPERQDERRCCGLQIVGDARFF